MPSCAIRNVLFPSFEVVIMHLLCLNALLSERIGIMEDARFIAYFLGKSNL